MSAMAATSTSRFEHHCNDCQQLKQGVQTRLEHAARFLCDDCSSRRSRLKVANTLASSPLLAKYRYSIASLQP